MVDTRNEGSVCLVVEGAVSEGVKPVGGGGAVGMEASFSGFRFQ